MRRDTRRSVLQLPRLSGSDVATTKTPRRPVKLIPGAHWAPILTADARWTFGQLVAFGVPVVNRREFHRGMLTREHLLLLTLEKRGRYFYLGYTVAEARRVSRALAEEACGCGFVHGMGQGVL